MRCSLGQRHVAPWRNISRRARAVYHARRQPRISFRIAIYHCVRASARTPCSLGHIARCPRGNRTGNTSFLPKANTSLRSNITLRPGATHHCVRASARTPCSLGLRHVAPRRNISRRARAVYHARREPRISYRAAIYHCVRASTRTPSRRLSSSFSPIIQNSVCQLC